MNTTFPYQTCYHISEILKNFSVRINGDRELPFRICPSGDGLAEVIFEYRASSDDPVTLTLQWKFPKHDVAGVWHSDVRKDRSIKADFSDPLSSMTTLSAPVICLYSDLDRNRCTFAFSEVRSPLAFGCYLHEEDSTFVPRIELKPDHLQAGAVYPFRLRVDVRDVLYSRAIRDVSSWWESLLPDRPMPVPEVAREPVYSTWYSYHQGVTAADIEKECRRAAELGCRTVIVDDGWQCEDRSRDYAYCGNWRFSESKFPDVRDHVARIHSLGLKYMIWISVPFLGYESRNYPHFADKVLRHIPSLRTAVLDIRYPEVRRFLTDTYLSLAVTFDLDGFKLDFVDEFYEQADSPAPNSAMDCSSVQDALNRLMIDLRDRLSSFKKDFLIEFRQRYIGPVMRTYGNMFRVSDCPGAKDTNRVGIADLRLLSGSTAVHSDMLLWHPSDTPQQAALNLIHCLFGTLQISVPLWDIPEEHLEMMRFWTSFMKDHRHTLLEAEFHPHQPQQLYPVLETAGPEEQILAVYQRNQVIDVACSGEHRVTYLVNGTAADTILLRTGQSAGRQLRCYDHCGRLLWETTAARELAAGLQELPVPSAGLLELRTEKDCR